MLAFLRSTVGQKYLMGLSGLIWAGFVFGHMAGNMLILVSSDAYNTYGHSIVSNKILLFGTEAALLAALFLHVGTAISLTIKNRQAKAHAPSKGTNGSKGVSLASRTMAIQGSLILAFIILHLITFKFGTYYETTVDGIVMRDLSRLILEVFQNPAYVAWYVVSLVLLGFHLSHGFGSIFQSFGLLHPGYQHKIRIASILYGLVVAGGFLSQPLYVFISK